MDSPNAAEIRKQLQTTIGPAPWYWKTFPSFRSPEGRLFRWVHQGNQGSVAFVVVLARENEQAARLALNTYCRPFLLTPGRIGIWSPEGPNIRIVVFDADSLQAFDLAEIAGWFKQSSERVYAATPPIAEFEIPLSLAPGMHSITIPRDLASIDELIVPTSYKALSSTDPAFALFVLYLQAGLVEVLPQKWFTTAHYAVGKQWISRAARDRDSHRIFGECYGVGAFLLEEDGCRLADWIDRA